MKWVRARVRREEEEHGDPFSCVLSFVSFELVWCVYIHQGAKASWVPPCSEMGTSTVRIFFFFQKKKRKRVEVDSSSLGLELTIENLSSSCASS